MESVIRKNASGGKGEISVKYILNEEEMNGKGKMFSEVTIAPGCSLGYHEHVGNSETYYIIRGEGEYNDNGTTVSYTHLDVYKRQVHRYYTYQPCSRHDCRYRKGRI